MSLFLRGVAIGFALAAPLGPVGVLCVRRALSDGRLAAFVSGLGAALADTVIGSVAGLGISVASSFVESERTPIRIVGGLFLVVLGIRAFLFAHRVNQSNGGSGSGLLRDLVSTFLITISNPATLLAAMGVFAAFGVPAPLGKAAALLIVVGMFAGSTLWWLMLSAAAGAVRSRVSPHLLVLLNRTMGVLLAAFGVAILGSALLGLSGWIEVTAPPLTR